LEGEEAGEGGLDGGSAAAEVGDWRWWRGLQHQLVILVHETDGRREENRALDHSRYEFKQTTLAPKQTFAPAASTVQSVHHEDDSETARKAMEKREPSRAKEVRRRWRTLAVEREGDVR
jgi:hypothetical protein